MTKNSVQPTKKHFRFKLRTLLKRQVKRERKFQKHLTNLKVLADEYLSEADFYIDFINVLEDALRVSKFHINALKDILLDIHSPRLIGDSESIKRAMIQKADKMQSAELGNSVTMEAAYTSEKGDFQNV